MPRASRQTSAPLGERIAELRRLSVESEDLAVPVEYFHDELARRDDFMDCGQSAVHPMLEEILRQAFARVGFEIELVIMLIHVAQHGLWHGAAQSRRGGLAVFFYFDELDIGVAQVIIAFHSGEQHYLRFKCIPLACSAPIGAARGGKA